MDQMVPALEERERVVLFKLAVEPGVPSEKANEAGKKCSVTSDPPEVLKRRRHVGTPTRLPCIAQGEVVSSRFEPRAEDDRGDRTKQRLSMELCEGETRTC